MLDAGSELFAFTRADLLRTAEHHSQDYRSAEPFPHVVLDDFLPEAIAERLLSIFPTHDDPMWVDWRKRNVVNQPRKQGILSADRLDGAHPFIHNLVFAFNSYAFVDFLETLTGIEGLIPDPSLAGAGLHQILPGGKLDIHADANRHPKLDLYRRLNALLYLNKGWKAEYGGQLEMWDRSLQRMVKRVLPTFNRCVIFNSDSTSFHGHPEPLTCPDDVTRKSLAFYYYTTQDYPGARDRHPVLWHPRPT